MNVRRLETLILGCTLAAAMTLVPACNKNPAATSGPPQAVIHGRILAADGSAPKLGNVRYTGEDGKEISLATKADGSFEITLTPGTPVTLYLAAVDHEEIPVPVLVEKPGTAAVTATLAPNPWAKRFDAVSVTGSWTHHSFSAAQPMTRRPDGTWVYEGPVPGSDTTARYELIGITTNGHSVNGTMGTGYAYDGGGDFDSIVPVEDGTVHIVFDPSKLPHYDATGLPKVEWDAQHKDLEEMARLDIMAHQWMHRFATSFQEHRKAGGKPEDFHFDAGPFLEALHRDMAEGAAGPVRQYAAVLLVTRGPSAGVRVTAGELDKVLGIAPPSSRFWGFGPSALSFILPHYTDTAAPTLERFVKENPLPQVRAWALAGEGTLARQSGDDATLRSIYETLKKDYAGVPGMEWVLRDLDPDKKIRVGKHVPHFDVKLFDGSHFTDKDLEGHWTLMDFWATWCGPCVGEMPYLDNAWKKFHTRGLRMVSFSLDQRQEDVTAFRKKKWKMPWKHAFLDGGFKNPLAQSFEVVGIPRPILVGPDGTIAAMEQDLRGDKLEATLQRFLGAK